MILQEFEIPVAYSMVALANHKAQPRNQSFQDYVCFWAAFNNIYTTLAEQAGLRPTLVYRDGEIHTTERWNYIFPDVQPVSERKQIQKAIEQLSEEVCDQLIFDTNTQYFVDRKPKGIPSTTDSRGQRINGVLNLTRTVDNQHPVWSPIDYQIYQDYIAGERTPQKRSILTEQIVFLLYTIRNNLVHGGKRADDANDRKVVEYALPLLKVLVNSFLYPLYQ